MSPPFKLFMLLVAFVVLLTLAFGCQVIPGIGQMSDRWCNTHPTASEFHCAGRALADSAK